ATRDGYASDLWVLDPATDKDRRVLPMQSMTEWWMAGPNAIWGSPYYSGKLARYDTKSHQVSSWSADRLLELIGIDSSGNPIILRGDRGGTLTGEVAVMHGDGRATS